MPTQHDIRSRFAQLTATLAEFDPACDPDFDGLQELEHEFATLRLQLAAE